MDQESVISKMESIPYTDAICPYIVGDMLDYYGERIGDCSLKTIWFCCRSRLLARRDYRDEIARNVLFCSGNNALSALCPVGANDEDYRNAMQSVIPEDSLAVVKFWQQLNIIMRVAEESLPFEDRKDPTAYLFRRNFGTHLHILGLSEPEIEYVIGHDIDDPYETRNEFVNEEKLFAIKQKMERRPLVNSDLSEIECIDVGERLQLQRTACVQIPVHSAETEMHITAKEPTDNIRVSLSVHPQSMRVQLNCRRYQVKETEYDRFVDTQQQYHKVYTKV